jgi:hypothetical protein
MQEELPPAPRPPAFHEQANVGKLEIHPLAKIAREKTREEKAALRESIRKYGIREPLTIYEEKIIDGRHRYAEASAIDYQFKPTDFTAKYFASYEQARAWVRDKAVNDKNLSVDDRRGLAKELIREQPTPANREIGRLCGLSHHTVKDVRTELDNESQAKEADDKSVGNAVRIFNKLDADQREQFVAKLRDDLLELLEI